MPTTPDRPIDWSILMLDPNNPDDTADYGPMGDPEHKRGPDETYCLRCGVLALEHAAGKWSVYGVCPALNPDDLPDPDGSNLLPIPPGPWYDVAEDPRRPAPAGQFPIPPEVLDLLPDADARVNPCPECEWGEVVMDGPMERDTGHQPYRCSVWCGWSA